MAKYIINFNPGEIEWDDWGEEAEQEIKEITKEFEKEFCMSDEKPKVFCKDCKYAIATTKDRESPDRETIILCGLTERNPAINYVTGLSEISFAEKESYEYGSFHYTETVKPKKLFGVIPRKSYEVPKELRFAKYCKLCNPRGDCPTFKQFKKPVVQKDGG